MKVICKMKYLLILSVLFGCSSEDNGVTVVEPADETEETAKVCGDAGVPVRIPNCFNAFNDRACFTCEDM